jgi:hypothetical protein
LTDVIPLIGPHEGRECDLMLQGLKPMAMFCDVVGQTHHFPEDEFRPHVAAGRFIRREEAYFPPQDHAMRCVYFCLPGEEGRIDEAHRLKAELYSGSRPWCDGDDRRFGALLGYSGGQIEAFLAKVRRRREVGLG